MRLGLSLSVLLLAGEGCFGCGVLPSGRTAQPTADDCDPGCDLLERCVRPAQTSTCSITCDYDEDCASGCCAPVEGGGAPVCALDATSCPDLSGAGGGAGGGSSASGGGSASSQGACATYSSVLNRAVCDPASSSSSCSGKYLGTGTTCAGFSCTSSTDASTCTVPGSGGTGGGSSTGDCSSAWSCTYDGQASPMCQAACAYTGQQRTFTCQQLVSLVGSATSSSCCAACR